MKEGSEDILEMNGYGFVDVAIDQSRDWVEFRSVPYQVEGATLARLYSIQSGVSVNNNSNNWYQLILILLGNFNTKPDQYQNYQAGFNRNGQGDEHPLKK